METSVSVIIPCYRCSNTITRAVDSVAKQTLRPAEVILVDDGSGDETFEVLKQLQDKYGKDWIKVVALESNYGPSVARNKGWELASQKYIAFLDADDAWHPEKIEIQYSWMANHSDFVLSAHSCIFVKSKDRIENDLKRYKLGCLEYKVISGRKILSYNRMATSTWMLKSSIAYRFNNHKIYSEDSLLLFEIIFAANKVAKLDILLAYRFRPYFSKGGLGGELWKMETEELSNYKIIWKSGKISLVEFWVFSAWSLIRYLRRIFINTVRESRLNKLVNT